jgi:hypothetical protein
MKKTLLFVGLLLIILVIFSNFQEGLEIPETNSIGKKIVVFEKLLNLKNMPMSELENSSLLSVTFRQSIHNYITPEELKSKTPPEIYNFLNSDPTIFKKNIQIVKGIGESTKLSQLTNSDYKPLFYEGFEKFIIDTDNNNTNISTSSTIRQAIDVLKAKEAAALSATATTTATTTSTAP